jgi:beta-glucosidase
MAFLKSTRLLLVPFLLPGALLAASPSDLQDTLVTNVARSNGPFSQSNLFASSSYSSGSSVISSFSTPTTSAPAVSFSLGTSSLSQPPIENGISTLPISNYSFTPFPTPTQSAIAGLFPSTNPKRPPPVEPDLKSVPNFGPAWAAAYEKAKAKVCLIVFPIVTASVCEHR